MELVRSLICFIFQFLSALCLNDSFKLMAVNQKYRQYSPGVALKGHAKGRSKPPYFYHNCYHTVIDIIVTIRVREVVPQFLTQLMIICFELDIIFVNNLFFAHHSNDNVCTTFCNKT